MQGFLKIISALIKEYRSLGLREVIDYEKFNLYAITHHSTNIEGSTLTEIETRLLLDEGLTPKGKPLAHSLMTKDHHEALQFIIDQAKAKADINEALVKGINALILKNTGATYNTVLGVIDSSKGEYRLSNVSAGNRFFVNYAKVPDLTRALCDKLQQRITQAEGLEGQLRLSFDAHFDLVSIHPFYDGNGRTSRLLMNFIQAYFDLPMSIVFKEDKVDYFEALEQSRKAESLEPFREFMLSQYAKYLRDEIDKFKKGMQPPSSSSGGFSMVF